MGERIIEKIIRHKTGKAGDKDAKRAKENSTCWKRKYQIWSGIFDPADPAGDLSGHECMYRNGEYSGGRDSEDHKRPWSR